MKLQSMKTRLRAKSDRPKSRQQCKACLRPGTELAHGLCSGPDRADCEALQPPLIPITDIKR